MVLKQLHPASIENTWVAEMQQPLSPYACAAKSLFSAKTKAKRLLGVKQKSVSNQCKINNFDGASKSQNISGIDSKISGQKFKNWVQKDRVAIWNIPISSLSLFTCQLNVLIGI